MKTALSPPPSANAVAPLVSKRWKWTLCFILFLATVLNYFYRQTVGLCKPQIMEEFHINNEEFGNLLAAFRWAYAFMHVPAGFLADRYSLRLLFGVAVLIWSAAGAAAFWVTSLALFKWTRAVLGFGEAVNWPFSTRIVANLLPREDRGLGMGIFNSGAAVGALLAPLIITPLAASFGWRTAFLAVGVTGLAWVALWAWFTRGRRAAALDNNPADRPTTRDLAGLCQPFKAIFSQPGFWLLICVSITINPCWYFCCDWIPGFLREQSGFSFLRAGLLTTVIFLGADIGNFAGGGLVKLLTHYHWSVRQARAGTVIVGACLSAGMAAVPFLRDAYVVILFLAIAALGINMIVPNQTACQTEVSFGNTAQLAGLTGFAANVFAALVNPRIGHYVDVTRHYDFIFYLVAIFPSLAAICILLFDAMASRRAEASLTQRVR